MLGVSHDDISSFRMMVDYRRNCMEIDQAYYFGVFTKSTKKFIGDLMLYNIVRGDVQNATVGANISSSFRGQGYGSEAMRGLVRHAFSRLGLHRLESLVEPANHVSIAMCKKAGFRNEGMRVRCVKENRRWVDRIVLAITREEL
jgi:[ribosomal protein S5]-alanine N-acetyltransferase